MVELEQQFRRIVEQAPKDFRESSKAFSGRSDAIQTQLGSTGRMRRWVA